MPSAEHVIEDQIDHEVSEKDLSVDDIDSLIADLQRAREELIEKR